MRAEDWTSRAELHRRFRYVGMALFCCAVVVELAVAAAVVTGGLPARNLMLGVFALGVSLGSFGTANDTALHAMLQLQSPPATFAAELTTERERRPGRLDVLHASPRMAFVLPVVASLTLALLVSRLLGTLA